MGNHYAFDFWAITEFSRYMHRVARPSAPDEIPNAPLSPSFEIDKKTPTTSTFNGIPNRFMITER